jgi:hypothetical protein
MIEPALPDHGPPPTTRTTLQQFAGLWLLFFSGRALWQWLVNGSGGSAIAWGTLAMVGLPGVVWPAFIRPLFMGLMTVTFPIGVLFSQVLLATVFHLMFTPIGLFFRIVGRDILSRRRDQRRQSYWVARPQVADIRGYFHQS